MISPSSQICNGRPAFKNSWNDAARAQRIETP